MVAVRAAMPRMTTLALATPLSRTGVPRTGGFASPPYDGFAKIQKSVRRIMVPMYASAMFALARSPET
jgi:hypothetical protein